MKETKRKGDRGETVLYSNELIKKRRKEQKKLGITRWMAGTANKKSFFLLRPGFARALRDRISDAGDAMKPKSEAEWKS